MPEEARSLEVVSEYEKEHATCLDFAKELERLIQTVLNAKKIAVHSVTSRVKSLDSLEGKINRYPGRYSRLSDITDLVGVRVITYFEDDVNRVGDVLKHQFVVVDTEDKRTSLSPDSFGYASLHYVVKLGTKRRRLLEYRRFRDRPAELQIRSILQHAWAEIEHDLGYKTKRAVPQAYVRGFARIAGLLELADAEFMRLRDGLRGYEKTVARDIKRVPESVDIDQASLRSFIEEDEVVRKLDERIGQHWGIERLLAPTTMLEPLLKGLAHNHVATIAQLKALMHRLGGNAARLANAIHRLADRPTVTADHGISVLYLNYYLAVERGSDKAVEEFVDYLFPDDETESAESFALRLRKAYEGIKAGGRTPSRRGRHTRSR